MVDTEYYDVLGLKKEDNPTPDQIRRAYKSMARKLHPDLNPDNGEKFSKVNEAYECLRDEDKKRIYDEYGKDGPQGGGGDPFGFGFPFGSFFGGGGHHHRDNRPQKGETVRQRLMVTLEELYNGATRKIRVTRTRKCQPCRGEGSSDPSKVSVCPTCQGQGFVLRIQRLGPGFVTQSRGVCTECINGKVVQPEYVCKHCNGKKVVEEKKTLEIFIEKGMPSDHKIVFEGEADERPGVLPGDICFQLSLAPHDTFVRENSHLKMKKKISLSSALTGCEFVFQHLDKRFIHVKSAKGEVISPGSVKMLKECGMPFYKSPFEKGNLFIEFEVIFPTTLNEQITSKLLQILPKKDEVPKEKNMEEYILEKPDFTDRSQKRPKDAYQVDDDEEMEEGGGVPCATS